MLKKIFVSLGIFLVVIYALFLIAPVCLTGLISKYDISKIIEDASGLKVNIEKVKIITTPKLTIGLKTGHVEAAFPTGEKIFSADNIQGKLSLLSVLSGKIEADMIGADNVNIILQVNNNGHLEIEDFITNQINAKNTQSQDSGTETTFSLPFGLKLSNHLPNIIINKYNIDFAEKNNKYSVYGNKISLTDFVINKKIKINIDGKFKLRENEQFNYNLKVYNQIMPDIDLNELILAPKTDEKKTAAEFSFTDIINIFEAIYKNKLTANIDADIKSYGTTDDIKIDGYFNVSNLSVAVDGKPLPAGTVSLKMNNNKIDLISKLHTADSDITEVTGKFITGKSHKINLNCKSHAKIKNIIDIADSIAKSFNINTLDTLSGSGEINADFSVKSDLKTVESSGYLKVPSASLNYGLYKIAIENIFADIQFANNSITIKDIALSILGQPLKIKGTIFPDSTTDMTVLADKLQIKGLLLAAGQAALLKDNVINSGTISLNVLLKGKLEKIVPKVYISADNVNVKNIPSSTVVTMEKSLVDLVTDGVKTNGKIDVNNVKIINPMAKVSAPKADILFGDKDILINNAYLLFNNSRIDMSGKISDYTNKNINFDITAKGNVLASDLKSMVPKEYQSEVLSKGTLPLNIKISGNDKSQNIRFKLSSNPSNYLSLLSITQAKDKNSEVSGDIVLKGDSLNFSNTGFFVNGKGLAFLKGSINDIYKSQKLNLNFSTVDNISVKIPFFKKSKMNIGGNINIAGNLSAPTLKGNVNIPSLSIPDLLLTIDDLNVSLNGPIAKGSGSLKKLVSGGITAENITSDFNLNFINNILYLKNITGDAFNGKINGNIWYDIINGHVGVDLKGSGMNAEKAIAGAAGIKNALSGKLGFSANVKTFGSTETQMMQNLTGTASFEINDGEFGNIGRFDNLILAQNLMTNPIIRAGVTSIKSLPIIKATAQFKTINGNLNFKGGWVDLQPVKTSGPSMSYYITGKYNLLNSTANVVILGRISAEVVKLLGPLGELSVSKLTSLIPGVGNATVSLIQAITTNPYGEKISEIPELSSGIKNYKNFKVQFNGGVESSSSVKSFRWLSVCDTSEIQGLTLKEQVQAVKEAVQDAKQKQIDAYNKHMEEQRQQAKEASRELKNAAEGIKNLFKTPKQTTENTTSTTKTDTPSAETSPKPAAESKPATESKPAETQQKTVVDTPAPAATENAKPEPTPAQNQSETDSTAN